MRILFHLYFRKLYFSGKANIPKDRAVLFAVNHPTAFLDPIFVASHINPTTSFLLRGDVFGNPIVKWFLRQINTIPIFRFRDGYANLKNNQDTFDYCYDLLGKGKHILILAEGQTRHEKRLRPIQKGAAKLLLGAYEKQPNSKYCILPVGVNYTASNKLRSEIMVGVGQAILLEDYLDTYKENPRKAVKKITDEITKQLKDKVVHIDRDEDVTYTNHLLTYKRNNRNRSLFPYYSDSLKPIKEEVQTVQFINNLDEATRVDIKQAVEKYEALLKRHKINDIAIAHPGYYNIINTLLIVLGFPFFIIGFFFHYLPFFAGKKVADKKVRLPAFYGSVRFGVASMFFIIPTIILLFIALFTLSWKLLLGILLFYALTYSSLHYQDLWSYWNAGRQWRGLDKNKQEELRNSRAKIFELI